MYTQIALGFFLIILSIIIQVTFIEIAVRSLKKMVGTVGSRAPSFSRFVITLTGISSWILISTGVVIWMWSFTLLSLGIFNTWEETIYFTLVDFTTLGFGDVNLPYNWRLLSGFIAADGFVLFGLNTAVLIETMVRLRADK